MTSGSPGPLTGESSTPLLDTVREPADIRSFTAEQLKQLAEELRRETIDAVSITGGHLGAGLGVVELTVALHHIFDTPRDRQSPPPAQSRARLRLQLRPRGQK